MKRLVLGVVSLVSLASLSFVSFARADEVAPNPVTTLFVAVGQTTAALSWTAPGDQCGNATLASYEVRYSTSAITECNFESATLMTAPTPSSPGGTDCADVPFGTLSRNTTYYFAVRCRDAAGNWSVISNVVSKTTHTTGPEVAC